MKKLAAIVVAMTVSTAAVAGERVTDTALGAVAGAVVLGPIGAAAGAFIGYTAGPSMSRAWGVRGRSASARHSRRTASNEPATYRDSQAAMPAPSPAPARPAAAKPAAKPPAVQPLE
jgi:hypothetical protein